MVAPNTIMPTPNGFQVRFGEWLPDMGVEGNPGLLTAMNVIPRAIGYNSFGRFVPNSTTQIPARPRGTISVIDVDKSVLNYVGTNAAIHTYTSRAFLDVSKSGGYGLTGDEHWDATQWRNTVIFTSLENPVQSITIGGANFADLITGTERPQARHIATLRNQWVVLGNTRDGTNGDQPTWLWFSARNDPTDFDPDVANLSKIEPLDADGGEIVKLISGEFLTVICRKAIYRVTFVGGVDLFRVDKVVRNRGAISSGSVVDFDRTTYFLDEDGYYRFDGVNAVSFGEEKFNDYTIKLLNWDYRTWISSAVDYPNQCLVWALPAQSTEPDYILYYNWKIDRAAIVQQRVQQVFPAYSQPLFSDDLVDGDLDIDEPPQSLWNIDAAEFSGGRSGLGAFVGSRLGFFSGEALGATIETGEIQPYAPYRAIVNETRVRMDGGGASETVAIGAREEQGDSVSWEPDLAVNMIGSVPNLAQGRFLRARVKVPENFNRLVGLDVMGGADSYA